MGDPAGKTGKTDGVIATNTTISREGLVTDKAVIEKIGAGGLSGKRLSNRSTAVISLSRKTWVKIIPSLVQAEL